MAVVEAASRMASSGVIVSTKALHPSQLKPHFAKFPAATQQAGEAFLVSLNADAAQQAAHLDALLGELKAANGDLRRGHNVAAGERESLDPTTAAVQGGAVAGDP